MDWMKIVNQFEPVTWCDLVSFIADLLAENIADAVVYKREHGEECTADGAFDEEYRNFSENLDWEMGKLREEICEEAERRLKE